MILALEHRHALYLIARCGGFERAQGGWWQARGARAWGSTIEFEPRILAELAAAGLVTIAGDEATIAPSGRRAA